MLPRPILLAAVLVLPPASAGAQLVRGLVVEAETGRPIQQARVELLDDRDRVLVDATADSTGAFRVRGWMAGKYRIRAGAFGYRAVTSDLLEVATGEELELTVRLAPEAVALDPISVVGRARSSLTEIALRGYYDRRDAGRRIGMGRFLDRAEIVERGSKLSDVLRRVPGLRIVRSGTCTFIAVSSNPDGTNRLTDRTFRDARACPPPDNVCPATVYLDGVRLAVDEGVGLDQLVPLEWVEAVEAYRRPAEMPAEFLGSAACGVVAIWTRRG